MEYQVQRSTGNVFTDLGLPHPEEALAKADLVIRIKEAMESEGLTQEEASERTRMPRPNLSKLLRGETSSFSLDRLFRALRALGQDIEIRVRPKPAAEDAGHPSLIVEPMADLEMQEEEPALAAAGSRA